MKYIDYDLDIKVFPDGEKRLLDVDEYEFHSKLMDYPEDIDFILKENVKTLVDWINNEKGLLARICRYLVSTLSTAIKKIADVNSPQKELGALAKMANAPSSKFSDLIGVIVLYSFRSVQCQHP